MDEELMIEKKVIQELDAAVDYGEMTKDEKIFIMAARLNDGHRTLTVGYANSCITVDADEVVKILEDLNGM